MTPNLLHLTRSCAKWRGGVLLVATLFLIGSAPPLAAPAAVTDLRARAFSDSAVVLTWTEVRSSNSSIPRYAVRYDSLGKFGWIGDRDVVTGGCAAPIVGSNTAGGRAHACVLAGLAPGTAFQFQIVAYTGTLNSTAVFGPLSNIVQTTTMRRIGPMLVAREPALVDSVRLTQVEFSDWPDVRWPIRGAFWTGDHYITAYHADSIVARGYLLVVAP